MNLKIELWSQPNCVFCLRAKDLFSQLNLPYEEYIIGAPIDYVFEENQSRARKADLEVKLPGVKTVPQIWFNDEYVGGYDRVSIHPMILEKLNGTT